MEKTEHRSKAYRSYIIIIFSVLIGLVTLAVFTAWVSANFNNLDGWITFLLTDLLCLGLFIGCWWIVKKIEGTELPNKLVILIIIAIILRLGLGILWYITLPEYGHDSPAERAGYVMADAHQRDQAAWDLAQSEKTLLKAFRNQRTVDQYGGLLFLSSLIYRYIGGQVHMPLQMVMVTATVSGLAILFTWLFVRRLWNQHIAWIAAWFLLLFPEAMLLGSSQMREAFTITLTMAAFYGLVGFIQTHSKIYLAWVIGSILLFLTFSPPFAALLTGMLILIAILWNITKYRRVFSWKVILRQNRFWIMIAGVVILIIIGVWFTLGQFAPDKITNPITLITWWFGKSADWQAHLTESASGKIQAIFDRTPEWSHAYLLLAYGIVQPFLPAALIVSSEAPIWQGIAIWRSLGWTIVLMLLIYASIRAWKGETSTLTRTIIIMVWLIFVVASYRGGGDQWDNPRYRATFAGLQIAIVAWAWAIRNRTGDLVFRYAIIWGILTTLWFIPWYLHREFQFPWVVGDVFKTLTLGIITTVLVIVWDWVRREEKLKTLQKE